MLRIKKYLTNSPSQTKGIGEKLAREILKNFYYKKAVVLSLEGELGGGKTTFLQGFAKGLGIKQKVLSPTFVIMKKYKLPAQAKKLPALPSQSGQATSYKFFYHIDCYRIKYPKEILDLEFKKIISESQNIIAIEWADRIRRILPKNIIFLKFGFVDNKTRKITIKF